MSRAIKEALVCFSATASFVAGGTLSAVGMATLARVRHRREIPFALIPLLFGIQQIVEGFVWLSLTDGFEEFGHTMTYVYSGFSHVLWPIYVPFAFIVLETEPWRRKIMLWFQAAGLTVGLYLLFSIVTNQVTARVEGRHVVYESPHFYLAAVILLYLAATCVTGIFSSHTFVRLFGGLALLSFIGAYVFAAYAVVSVWCFFAAILSLLIYLHLRCRSLGGFPVLAPSVAPASASVSGL